LIYWNRLISGCPTQSHEKHTVNVTNGKFFEEENKEGPPQKITLSGGYYKHILRKRMSDIIQIHANSSPVCQKKKKKYILP